MMAVSDAYASILLEVQGLCCGYGGVAVLRDVSFSVRCGQTIVLLGENGVGKSTLFKTILGLLPKIEGHVMLLGRDASSMTQRELARVVAYVPQGHNAAFGFSVREMVLMGRTPLIAGMGSPRKEDERAVDEVLERLSLGRIAQRDFITLSGGEKQMVLIARALASNPKLLVMDEPCANLDLRNQALVLSQVAMLARQGIAVLITSHDPNHAFALKSDVVCIQAGEGIISGKASDILSADFLSELYGTPIAVGGLERCGTSVTACAPVVEGGEDGKA